MFYAFPQIIPGIGEQGLKLLIGREPHSVETGLQLIGLYMVLNNDKNKFIEDFMCTGLTTHR